MKVLHTNQFWTYMALIAGFIMRLILPYKTPKIGDIVVYVGVKNDTCLQAICNKGVVVSVSDHHLVVRECYPCFVYDDDPPYFQRWDDGDYSMANLKTLT